ncbi:MAG: glycosyltransferase family 4 protein [Balneolaceae bacterium]|nr:glycosyltransferase family 4 protein [Balneolaceae bacterium]
MKILLIAQFDKFGGTREAFKRILNIHQKNGFKTHAIIGYNSDDAIKKYIREKGAEYTELTRRGKLYRNMVGSLFYEHLNYHRILKLWKPDLIVTSIGTSNFALYPFIRRYPMVYILHTIPMELSPHIRWFYKVFSLLSGKDQLVCGVSEATVKSVSRNWGYDEEKTVVVHNTFIEENVAEGNKVSHKESNITVLTLGIISWYKNPDLWLKVAKKITKKYKNVKFLWLGDGKLFDKFRQQTVDESQIHFLGFRENVKRYYSEASIYFQPSLRENHSYSVLDAMANGLPSVVSNVGGQSESIEEGVNGYLCESGDSTSFVEKISILIENPDLRLEMGKRAKNHAFRHFHPKEYDQKLLNVYKKALEL